LNNPIYSHIPSLTKAQQYFERRDISIIVLSLMMAAYLATILLISLFRESVFRYGSTDLTCYVQAIWKIANGNIPYQTIYESNIFLGAHFMPIGYVLGVMFRLFPSNSFLIILQAFAFTIGAVPLFLLAKDVLGSKGWGLAIAFLYLTYYPLYQSNLFDFHPEKLCIPFLLFGFYFMHSNRKWLSLIFIILALSCKEYFSFSVLALGIFYFFRYRQKQLGLVVTCISILWLVMAYKIVMPQFGKEGMAESFEILFPFADRSGLNAIIYLFTHPGFIISRVFRIEVASYLLAFFSPLLFIPLMGIEYLIPALPILGINILANFNRHLAMDSQYQVFVFPFIFIALIFGIERIKRWLREYKRPSYYLTMILVFLILLLNFNSYRYYPYKVKQSYQLRQEYVSHSRILALEIAKIPADAKVACEFMLTPYFAKRAYVYSIITPYHLRRDNLYKNFGIADRDWFIKKTIDYIVLDKNYNFHWIEEAKNKRNESIADIESSRNYEKKFDNDGLIIFRAKGKN